MVLRWTKILLTACVGVLAALVGLDNILDYGTNFAAVQHVLSMDTIPPDGPFAWRAIASTPLHHLAYGFIIALELAAGAFCLAGAAQLARARKLGGRAFNEAKQLALLGLVVAFALYFLGFMVIGGEWFQMWRSNGWNMQEPAFRFVGAVGIILLFVAQRDGELGTGTLA
jgi:predicted small integral membrane protein